MRIFKVYFVLFSCMNVCVCIDVCVYMYMLMRVLMIGMCVCVERETCVVLEGFESESFPLKYNHTSSEYKIHSIEVDLYYFKYL